MTASDEAMIELGRLVKVIDETIAQLERVRERARHIEQERLKGQLYAEIVPNEDRPLIVETLSEVLDGLADAAGRFRRAEARALYQEGWTHEQISRFFGVTRQRIGALLGRERKRTTPA